jgi:hypothetical protein
LGRLAPFFVISATDPSTSPSGIFGVGELNSARACCGDPGAAAAAGN